ncbi:hypothetical protein DPMN_188273 [Dreissena polymorpha]|uniref:Uncharacterized protein n=1 Tax=Dreissena polymorpha TaxID=45954 RepID=A0A9D4DRB7_DREPO|nr:hypothetical protein DPMN_188273 [Dreissena polymorpha]
MWPLELTKTAPPPGGHVYSPIWTIFELIRDINETNVLTKFHDDWEKLNTAPPPGGHVFARTGSIFKLNQYIILTNILTKLHEDWASNVISTEFTSFELSRGINGTNDMTRFHDDQTINVASRVFTRQNVYDGRRTTDKRRSQKTPPCGHTSRVLTCFHCIHIEKTAPPHVSHVFILLIKTIFDLAKNVTSRVFTRNNAPPPGRHIFQGTGTIFEFNQHIIRQTI